MSMLQRLTFVLLGLTILCNLVLIGACHRPVPRGNPCQLDTGYIERAKCRASGE